MDSALARFDPLYRTNGNGSRSTEEDWLDENSTAAENQWSTAATTFYISDAPDDKKQQFRALYEMHNGWGEGDRRGTIRHSHIVNDAQTFANVLEMPQPERKRVVEVAEDIDFNRYGGKSYEKILLAICSLVSDAALSRRVNSSQPNSDDYGRRLVLSDEFRDLMDANNLGSSEHSRIREIIRTKTKYFE